MATVRDVISRALRLLGVVQQGRAPTNFDAAAGLEALQGLLDGWSNDKLNIFRVTQHAFDLVGNQASYTLGPGGNWDIPRPMELNYAYLRYPSGTFDVDFPLTILNDQQFSSIPIKEIRTNIPMFMFDNAAFPLRQLTLYPVPTAAFKVILWLQAPLDNFTTLDDAVQFPRGYTRALVYNLAIELAPEYNRSVTPELQATAAAAKADLQRLNLTPRYLRAEGGYLPPGRPLLGPSVLINPMAAR